MRTRIGSADPDTEIAGFAGSVGHPLDEFQLRAVRALAEGRSVVVAAPTGAGKTVVAEFGLRLARNRGLRSVYTTPIKALSNQKFHDLCRVHGAANVGLLTGDHSIRPDAPVVVMTTEVLRNMIYADRRVVRTIGVVVLDEVHYLQDPYRGGVWEEVIIHLPPECALVCLSATVSNAEEFADWVGTLRGDTEVVIEESRPVPLRHHYCVGFGDDVRLYDLFGRKGDEGDRSLNPRIVQLEGTGRRGAGKGRGLRTPRRVEVIESLDRRGMLPAIYFIFSRSGCDRAVGQLLQEDVTLTTKSQRRRIREIATERVGDLDRDDLAALGWRRFLGGLEAGIAAHHAGMVPTFRETVEALFAEGLVKVVFATETLALGVNMPAKCVVIEKLTKFGGERHEPLTAGQYTQLTGRAGRRGIDPTGDAVVLWSPFVPYEQVAQLASARTYRLVSSFRPTYNMVANLVSRFDRETAHRIVNSSFAQFQADSSVVQTEAQAARLREAADAYRERAECSGCAPEVQAEAFARLRASGRSDRRQVRAPRTGDIAVVGGVPVVVLQRGGGAATRQYRVVGVDADITTVDGDALGGVVGHIAVPEPVVPKDRRFRAEVAERLARATRRLDPGAIAAAARRTATPISSGALPCDSCPDAAEKFRWLGRALDAERDAGRLELRIERRAGSLSRRFDEVCAHLVELGHLDEHDDGWSLTAKGELLARLYTETDLLTAETIASGALDGLDPAELAAALSLFTYESRRDAGGIDLPASATLRAALAEVVRVSGVVRSHESAAGLEPSREVDGGFCGQAYAWTSGAQLEDVLADALAGGDFVRNVKQLADMCRQVADATAASGIAGPVGDMAERACAEMWRGVVALSSVLEAGDVDPFDRATSDGDLSPDAAGTGADVGEVMTTTDADAIGDDDLATLFDRFSDVAGEASDERNDAAESEFRRDLRRDSGRDGGSGGD